MAIPSTGAAVAATRATAGVDLMRIPQRAKDLALVDRKVVM
jgi:hypothetical protein